MPNKPILKTENLTIKIKQQKICVNFTWQVCTGQIWGLIGPNGCGKTTLLETLAGLLNPQQGKIFLNGINIATLSKLKLAKIRGMLFQHSKIDFPQTVWDYCSAGLYPHHDFWNKNHTDSDSENKIINALTANSLKLKYSQCVTTLSGGELQRLAFATLLIQDPEIYLLDEPFNHLDLKHKYTLQQQLNDLAYKQNKCIIMATHDLHILKNICSHITMLNNNEIIFGKSTEYLNSINLAKVFNYENIHNIEKQFTALK